MLIFTTLVLLCSMWAYGYHNVALSPASVCRYVCCTAQETYPMSLSSSTLGSDWKHRVLLYFLQQSVHKISCRQDTLHIAQRKATANMCYTQAGWLWWLGLHDSSNTDILTCMCASHCASVVSKNCHLALLQVSWEILITAKCFRTLRTVLCWTTVYSSVIK